MNDGLRETSAMAIAFGQCVDTLIKDRFEEAEFDGAIDSSLERIAAHAAEFGAESKKTFHRHVDINRARLQANNR